MNQIYKIAALLFGIVLIGTGLWWLNLAPLSVHIAPLEKDIEARLFGIGTVEAQINSKIGFQIAGKIIALEADQGEILEAGKIIARLDSSVQAGRVQKSQVALQQSDATLAKAQAILDRAKTNYQQKQAIADRRETLAEKGAATREATDEARTQAEIAKADVLVAEADFSLAQVARKDMTASAMIESSILDQHVLTTPYRARIISRLKELGSAVNPAEPVFSVIAPESIWVRAFIDEAMAGALKIGQTAFVRLRSDPTSIFEAQIVRIDEENDRVTEERRIYVRCRQCSPEHMARHLGEQAEVEVVTDKISEGYFIPLYAIAKYNGHKGSIWTLESGHLSQREVTLGQRLLDGRVHLIETLPKGVDIVVERDISVFREGRAARSVGAHR